MCKKASRENIRMVVLYKTNRLCPPLHKYVVIYPQVIHRLIRRISTSYPQ